MRCVIELALRESRAVIRRKERSADYRDTSRIHLRQQRRGRLQCRWRPTCSPVARRPDRSARKIHREIKKRTGLFIPVLITDTFGRPWREGLVDYCIGIAGMKAHRDDRGRRDPHGYTLHASLEAVADELAAAAGLVCGKLHRTPAASFAAFPTNLPAGRSRDLLRIRSRDLFR